MSKAQNFATCPCQHCGGHIEFDASHKGVLVACPHCGLETKLFAPSQFQVKKQKLAQLVPHIHNVIKRLGVGGWLIVVFTLIFLGGLVLPLAFSPVNPDTQTDTDGGRENFSRQVQQAARGWSKSLVVQQGDLQIKVEGWSEFDRVLIDAPGEPGNVQYCDHLLTIRVALSNLSTTKKIDFTTWRGKNFHVGRDYATLTDNNGNVYKRIDFGFKGIKNSNWRDAKNETAIYPQDSFEDLLVFEPTVKNLKWLHLELPAENFDGSGMIRFEIPISETAARYNR